MTPYQADVLATLAYYTGRTRDGNGPWERAWVYPHSPAESRAMAALHAAGHLERRLGRRSGKLPHAYRHPSPPPPDRQDTPGYLGDGPWGP